MKVPLSFNARVRRALIIQLVIVAIIGYSLHSCMISMPGRSYSGALKPLTLDKLDYDRTARVVFGLAQVLKDLAG